MLLGRALAIAGLLVGLAGLTANFIGMSSVMTISPTNPVARSLGETLVYFWTFFTHLSNLGVVLVYAAALLPWPGLAWFRHPVTLALVAGQIALVMVYFHLVLAPLYDFEGPLALGNVLLHYVGPVLYLGWWLAFAPHGSLRYRDIPLMLVPGMLYVVVVLVRGAMVGEYPYAILDPRPAGYFGVAAGVFTLVGAVAVFCAVMVLVDNLIGRRARTA